MKSDSQFSMKYENMLSSKFSVLYQARYCAQEDISLVICEDKNIKVLEHPFYLKNITTDCIRDCSLLKTNCDSKLVVSGSNLYVLDEYEPNTSFVKFSESSKRLNVLPFLPDKRSRFSVCSFMQKIVVIGGNINYKPINTCLAYDTKTNKWTDIASMYKTIGHTSSTVFKGKLWLLGVG